MLKYILYICSLLFICQSFSSDHKDYLNPLWKVDEISSRERVNEIEKRLKNIGDVLRENFEDEDPDVETILFHIEQIRFALYGFEATYGVRLP